MLHCQVVAADGVGDHATGREIVKGPVSQHVVRIKGQRAIKIAEDLGWGPHIVKDADIV